MFLRITESQRDPVANSARGREIAASSANAHVHTYLHHKEQVVAYIHIDYAQP